MYHFLRVAVAFLIVLLLPFVLFPGMKANNFTFKSLPGKIASFTQGSSLLPPCLYPSKHSPWIFTFSFFAWLAPPLSPFTVAWPLRASRGALRYQRAADGTFITALSLPFCVHLSWYDPN